MDWLWVRPSLPLTNRGWHCPEDSHLGTLGGAAVLPQSYKVLPLTNTPLFLSSSSSNLRISQSPPGLPAPAAQSVHPVAFPSWLPLTLHSPFPASHSSVLKKFQRTSSLPGYLLWGSLKFRLETIKLKASHQARDEWPRGHSCHMAEAAESVCVCQGGTNASDPGQCPCIPCAVTSTSGENWVPKTPGSLGCPVPRVVL